VGWRGRLSPGDDADPSRTLTRTISGSRTFTPFLEYITVDSCITVADYGIQHDTSSAEYDEYEIVARAGKIYMPTCKADSGPNGALAYPANRAGSSSSGTFDINTNGVSDCTSE
jgi:hypothetical protein